LEYRLRRSFTIAAACSRWKRSMLTSLTRHATTVNKRADTSLNVTTSSWRHHDVINQDAITTTTRYRHAKLQYRHHWQHGVACAPSDQQTIITVTNTHRRTHTDTERETDRQQTYARWWRTMPPNSNWRRFWCIVVMGNIEMFASVSHQYNHYFTWSQRRTVDDHELITPPWKCIFGKCCLWLWPSNSWPWKCDQFVALCGNHLSKFWLKSFQRLKSYRVNKISLWPLSLADLELLWPSDLVNVISVMRTWYWITVISFIKILPFVLNVQRW